MAVEKEQNIKDGNIQLVDRMNLRLLLLVTGVGAIIAVIFITLVAAFLETRQHAELINLSGQQRSIAQRIALLAYRYADLYNDPVYRMAVETQLLELTDQMEENHFRLISPKRREGMSPVIEHLYFGPAAQVNKNTEDFIQAARNIIEGNLSEKDREKVVDDLYFMSRDAFMTDLDRIVQTYQKENQDQISFLSKVLGASALLSIGALVFAVFGIFRPVTRQIKTSVLMRTTAEEKVKDAFKMISDSINYASRIQRAILPKKKVMDKVVPDHFILWEPRDVVGGDIYWQRYWGPGTLIILGDCTGHGVPGAFMTLISNGALDEAYLETPPGDPATLLQRMHQLIQAMLGQDKEGGSEYSDGIELGACYLDEDNKTLVFAGARFDLFIVENGEVTFIKGTKAGLGYHKTPFDVKFENHTIDLTPDQTFYMTSDGLIDQLGGEKRRGFGKKRFKALITSLDGVEVCRQRVKIMEALTAYQGDEKRRDDVSVIGFKINAEAFVENNAGRGEFEFLLALNCRELDEDHRKLHGMVQTLKQSVENREGYQATVMLFTELASYTQWHFRHEERLMRVNAFPDMAEHNKEHQDLLAQLHGLLDHLDGLEKEKPLSMDVIDFLDDWLKKHILELDRKLAGFLIQMENYQERTAHPTSGGKVWRPWQIRHLTIFWSSNARKSTRIIGTYTGW